MAAYYNDNTILFHEGKYLKATALHSDFYSQTLHYGYGVFEGIRAYETAKGAKIFKAEEHYERLIKSAELLNIPFRYSVKEMIDITYEVLAQNNFTDAYIRPVVTCSPNMSLFVGESSSLTICAWNWAAFLGEKQIRIKISSFCRPHPRSIHPEAKACGHYVNSVLAGTEAKQQGFDEALLLDVEGYLAEGPGANMFFEKDGKLFTPATGHILKGITRSTVMELAKKLGIAVEEGRYLPEALYNADSAFYCGTGAEIVGIESVDNYTMKKAWSDSLGKKLKEEYLNLVREKSNTSVNA
jgi:branched-chain amino acid aminotransferase